MGRGKGCRHRNGAHKGFSGSSAGKESSCNAGVPSLIPGLGRSPGEGKGYSPQYSGLENSMDCIVHGITKSRTGLSDFHFRFLFFVVWVKGPTSFFYMWSPGCPSTICLEDYLFHIKRFWHPCQKINLSRTYGSISGLSIILYSSIYLSTYYAVLITVDMQ